MNEIALKITSSNGQGNWKRLLKVEEVKNIIRRLLEQGKTKEELEQAINEQITRTLNESNRELSRRAKSFLKNYKEMYDRINQDTTEKDQTVVDEEKAEDETPETLKREILEMIRKLPLPHPVHLTDRAYQQMVEKWLFDQDPSILPSKDILKQWKKWLKNREVLTKKLGTLLSIKEDDVEVWEMDTETYKEKSGYKGVKDRGVSIDDIVKWINDVLGFTADEFNLTQKRHMELAILPEILGLPRNVMGEARLGVLSSDGTHSRVFEFNSNGHRLSHNRDGKDKTQRYVKAV